MSDSPGATTVRLDHTSDGIATLTLDRPDAGNSLSTGLVADLASAVRSLTYELRPKAVVVTGSGRFFCAGADLKERDRPASWLDDVRAAFDDLAAVPALVIAAINGACMGGGLELALACDVRIAARSARLGLPEIRFGALPAAGGPQRLARVIGPGRTKLLVCTGRHLSAEEAEAMGVVDLVVDDADLLSSAGAIAAEAAVHAGYAIAAAKAAVDGGFDAGLAEALRLEYRIIDTMATPEERAEEVRRAMERSATYGRIFTADKEN